MQKNRTPSRPHSHRRRRRRINPEFIFTCCLLTALIVGLVILCVRCSGEDETPQPTVTEPTQITTEATEPTTEPTTEPSTEPVFETPRDELEAFAAEHGLTIEDYPAPILELLERNPEAWEFALHYPLEYGKDHEVDISGYENYKGVPLFLQWDKQWGYLDYGGSVAGLSACGPTTLAMAAYHFTRDPKMTPAYMIEFAQENDYILEGQGSRWLLFSEGAKKLGLDVKELTAEDIASEEKLARVLESGKLIVTNVKPGVFTTVGHYLLVVGYEDGKFRVNDPNSVTNSEKLWSFDEFDQDIRMMWAVSG